MPAWLTALRSFLQQPHAQRRDPDGTLKRILIACVRWSGELAPTASDGHNVHTTYSAVRFAMLRILQALNSTDPALDSSINLVLNESAQTALITMETSEYLNSPLDAAALIQAVLAGVIVA